MVGLKDLSELKILFLDIDGVLNINAGTPKDLTFFRTQNHMETHLVQRFNNYLNQNEVKIIISSSWRDDMDDLQKQLERVGFKHWDRVVGRTGFSNSKSRGKLIAEVIESRDIKEYAIIDDYVNAIIDCECVDSTRIVQTSPYYGISVDNVHELENIFL